MKDNCQPELSDATIGVVTALPKEYAAAKEILGCHREVTAPGRGAGRTFALAQIPARSGGHHIVALAMLVDMGNNLAAIAATRLLHECPHVQHIVMCGIAGAVPHPDKPEDHVRLGDIVVSDRGGVVQYDFDKESSDGIEIRNRPASPSAELLEAVRHLHSEELLHNRSWEGFIEEFVSAQPKWRRPPPKFDRLKDWEDQPAVSHPGRPGQSGKPRVFLGPIASANKLLKNPTKRDMLRDQFGVKAVEMEGSGIADATWHHGVGYLVVRGTCDYCNSDKGKRWQKYASVVAAAYTRAVIEAIPAEHVDVASPPKHLALSHKVVQEPHEKRKLLDIDNTPKLDKWPHQVQAGLHDLISKLGSTTALFDANQGSLAFDASKSGGDSLKLSFQWSGAGDPTSPVQPSTGQGVSEPAVLAIRSFLESIDRSRKQFDFAAATDTAAELDDWLKKYEASIPLADICKAYIALAEVEQIQLALAKEQGRSPDDSRFRDLVDKAKQVELPRATESLARHLAGLSADLTASSDGYDAGLAELGVGADPETMRYRLKILLDAERLDEAVECARSQPLHGRWCELAVMAFGRAREDESVSQAIKWAERHADSSLRRRCVLRYAFIQYLRALLNRSPGDSIAPGQVSYEEREELGNVLDILDPLLVVVKGNRRVETQLEFEALQLAVKVNAFLCNLTAADELASLLTTRQPVPLELAELVLGGWVSCPRGLPAKLRTEHPDSVRALILSELIDGEIYGKSKDAFDAVVRLEEDAVSQHEEELLCRALHELGQQCDAKDFAQARETTRRLLGEDHGLVFQHDVEQCLRDKGYKNAKALLESHRDEASFIWLQMYANYHQAIGDNNTALAYYERASQIVPHPSVLQTVAHIGFQQGRFRSAAGALERTLDVQPDDVTSRRNLAITYARMHKYAKAVVHFAKLRESGSASVDDNIDYAGCLAHSGRRDDALAVYKELCAADEPPMVAIIGHARLLKSLNRPDKAFGFLHEIRGDYWDQPDFVAEYQHTASAADEDRNANTAFQRLLELQQKPETGHKYLQPKSLEDLVEYAKDFRERRNFGYQQILQGRLPWLLVDTVLGNTPYWGWRLRTQEMRWISEDPLECASYAIYSTNGYAVAKQGQDDARLTPLECPARGTAVVADLSALITLHRLGLLDAAAEYFETVIVPVEYLAHAVADSERLIPHQLSQKKALEAIRGALDSEMLSVTDDSDTRSLPFVHEHTTDDDSRHLYRLVDVIGVLGDVGRIGDDVRSHLSAVARKPSGADDEHPPLAASSEIRIALSTLKTLHNFDVLDAVLEAFQVKIIKDEHDEIDAGLRAYEVQDDVRKWHDELWERVGSDSRFQKVPYEEKGQNRSVSDGEELPEDASLFALKLANERKLPLLVDDRFCQMAALNKPDVRLSAAFATDKLLLALCDTGILTLPEVTDGLLSLMKWRYRFILPSATILKTIADRFAGGPPGKDLRDIAAYMHDCMRDPGLFSGPEPTAPPLPVAFRLHQDWAMTISHLLIDIWSDEEKWTADKASVLTRWATTEFLPSSPRGMGMVGIRLASFVSDTVLTQAVIHSVGIGDVARANEALLAIADGLGVTRDKYEKLVVGVIDAL